MEAAGGKVVRISMNEKTGTFDPKQFINAISKKTKMICLCNPHNPHNPIGRVFSRQELLFIGSLAAKHKLWIMNDEILSDIVFPGSQHINIASLHLEITERTISVYGFSKTLQTSKANTTDGGVSTLSQVAGTAAYENCWYWVDAFLDHLTKVRDNCVERLNKMSGVESRTPQGTYLLFLNIKNFGLSSEEMTLYLLENANVAVAPGAANWIGPGAEGHIRISFSKRRFFKTNPYKLKHESSRIFD